MARHKIIVTILVSLLGLFFMTSIFPLFPNCTIALIGLDEKYSYVFHVNSIGFLEMKTKEGFDGLEKEYEQRGTDEDVIEYKRKFLLGKQRKIILKLLDEVTKIGSTQSIRAMDGMIPDVYCLINGDIYWCPYHEPDELPFEDFERGDMLRLVDALMELR